MTAPEQREPAHTRVRARFMVGDWRQHLAAATAALADLGDLPPADLTAGLLALLADPAAHLRERAACGLHRLPTHADLSAAVTAALASALVSDPCAGVRYHAAYALAAHHDPAVIPALVTALRQDADADVRYRAAYALGVLAVDVDAAAWQEADPVAALITALHDPRLHVQHSAARALGRIGDRRAIPALRRLHNTDSPRLRAVVAWALGQFSR